MSKITVTTIAGQTSGSDANTVKIESGDTLAVQSNATIGGTAAITGNTTVGGTLTSTGTLTANGLSTLVGSTTHGTDAGDTRFNLNGPNQYRAVFKHAGNIAGQIGGSGADVLRFSNAAGATTLEANNGKFTMPLQPYFEACFSTSGWTDYAKGGTWVKMDMDATITNVGGHYNTTNKHFVAPVTGKYFFSASIFLNVTWNSSTPYLSYLGFYKNNAFFTHFGQDVQSTEHIRHSIIVPMQANDYMDVRIQQAQSPTTNQYYKHANARNYTYFHGMLIG